MSIEYEHSCGGIVRLTVTWDDGIWWLCDKCDFKEKSDVN